MQSVEPEFSAGAGNSPVTLPGLFAHMNEAIILFNSPGNNDGAISGLKLISEFLVRCVVREAAGDLWSSAAYFFSGAGAKAVAFPFK
jgi:hypothetical protein